MKDGRFVQKDSPHRAGVIKEDGTLDFLNCIGKNVCEEITPRKAIRWIQQNMRWLPTTKDRNVEVAVEDLTAQEQVKKQAFQLIKISEDGNQTETDLVEGWF